MLVTSRGTRAACLFAFAALLLPAASHGQDPVAGDTAADPLVSARRAPFRISMIGGYQKFAASAALDDAPLFGMRISNRRFGILSYGATAAFARPTTRGDYFPYNRATVYSNPTGSDTTIVYRVSQRVTMATYGLEAGVAVPLARIGRSGNAFDRIELQASAAAGAWTFWLDPEQSRGNRTNGNSMVQYGGGLSIPIGRSSALALRVEDVVFMKFTREQFSLADPLLRDDLFPNATSSLPKDKSTVHNPRLTVSFTFVPTGVSQ